MDDYMRTSAEGVFAVGDCALKRDFFTRRAVPVWLASTATAEARVAGINIYGIRVIRQIQGTIAAFSTKIGNRSFASAGMTCRACEKEGFRYLSATSTAPDRHPGTLPGASALKLKLVFSDRSGILLGGQISGGSSVGELINVIALGIQKRGHRARDGDDAVSHASLAHTGAYGASSHRRIQSGVEQASLRRALTGAITISTPLLPSITCNRIRGAPPAQGVPRILFVKSV